MVPEQAAALQALAVISGRDAAQAVSQLIVRGVVQGPALNLAVSTAARIGSALPADVLRSLYRDGLRPANWRTIDRHSAAGA
jgi:hypothetical protein